MKPVETVGLQEECRLGVAKAISYWITGDDKNSKG